MDGKAITLRGVALAGIMSISSGLALADDTMSGIVSTLDRTTGTIVLQQTQSGTVGSSSGNPVSIFRIKGSIPESLHAGDKVTVTFTEADGSKMVTKIDEHK